MIAYHIRWSQCVILGCHGFERQVYGNFESMISALAIPVALAALDGVTNVRGRIYLRTDKTYAEISPNVLSALPAGALAVGSNCWTLAP